MDSIVKITASEHPIKSVTVFKSKTAEIVRLFALDLKAGQNKVEIKGLPSVIDTHSVRVSGLGDARIFDVVCTIGNGKVASYAPTNPSEIIRTLRAEKTLLEGEKRLREQEADLLHNYAKSLDGEHVTTTSMSTFLETFTKHGQRNLEAVNTINEKIIAIERQIESESEKTSILKGSSNGVVTVVIGADANSSVELKLTYIVSNTYWQPTYELHATTENGKPSSSVTLQYRARVVQSTGEDWNHTALTLSTIASDTVIKNIPRLVPYKYKQRPSAFETTFNKGSLFGPANDSSQKTRLFGGDNTFASFGQAQQQQQQPALGGGLFGQANQQQQPALRGGLFGQAHQQQQPAGNGGLFGSAAPTMGFGPFGAAPTTSAFSTFGAPATYTSDSTHLFGHTSFGAATGASAAVMPQAPATELQEEQFEEITTPGAITEPTTVVTETPVAISYSVHGKSTIPTDGEEHQVSVAVLPFEATISYVTVPRVDPRVYLQCQVKNNSEYRLLRGPVSVILDDSYVSKTSINDINTGDTFDCNLGDDTSTKVTYFRTTRITKHAGGSFAESMSTTTYTTRITIHNTHQFTLHDLVVRDVVPTCDDKRAKIILTKPKGLADAKDGEEVDLKKDGLKVAWGKVVYGKGGEKEGKFEWRWKIDSGATVVLDAEWDLKAPSESSWLELPA